MYDNGHTIKVEGHEYTEFDICIGTTSGAIYPQRAITHNGTNSFVWFVSLQMN